MITKPGGKNLIMVSSSSTNCNIDKNKYTNIRSDNSNCNTNSNTDVSIGSLHTLISLPIHLFVSIFSSYEIFSIDFTVDPLEYVFAVFTSCILTFYRATYLQLHYGYYCSYCSRKSDRNKHDK